MLKGYLGDSQAGGTVLPSGAAGTVTHQDSEKKVCNLKYEGRGTRDEGRGTRDEGRGTRDEGRGTRDEGRGTRDEERNVTWNVERGTWSAECGTWTVDCGLWNVECVTWNVEREWDVNWSWVAEVTRNIVVYVCKLFGIASGHEINGVKLIVIHASAVLLNGTSCSLAQPHQAKPL
jgi:hypothetical protein